MLRKSLFAALFIAVAASSLPATSFAGVMPITDKADLSLSAQTTQVDWRAYPHRHHRWQIGWHYGGPRYELGAYYGSATPLVTVRPIYPYECPYYTTPYHGDSIYK
jgi:hypothetical protein